MIDKVKTVGNTIVSGVEATLGFFFKPPVKALDWLARKWLKHELIEKEEFSQFLETSMAEQRSAMLRYISENKALSERLSQYEKFGEENMLKQKEWLAKESRRVSELLNEQMENNEKLNLSNAKMRVAGDAMAELIAINKPKRRLTKKDKQIQSVIEDWNKNSR